MDHDAESASATQRGTAPARPIMRPARLPEPDTGPGGPPGPERTRAGRWHQDRRVRTAGAVVLGVMIGVIPGLVLALDAQVDSRTAQKRAAAAEQAVRVWQQQAAEESGVAPSQSALTGTPPTSDPTPGGTGATGPGGAGGAGGSLSASPTARPQRVSGEGTYRVGTDIRPGVWRSKANNGCHWERQRNTADGRILVGYGNPLGDVTITIRPTDDRFKTSKCNDWIRIG